MMRFTTGLMAATLLLSAVARAEDPAPSAEEAAARKLLAELKPQDGAIALPGGLAALNLTEGFRYLTPHDAKRLLEEGWGNPPSPVESTLGMIVPAAVNPLSSGGWGVIVTYNDDGHVSDEDAGTLDYGALLKQMQEAVADNNESRTKAGYAPLALHGWAEPPHYDAASHKIYWAKDLVVGNNTMHTLNYYVRVLGRQGVLELNAVAAMDQLPKIRDAMKQVEGFSDFTAGNRYAEFNSGTDKLAAYGLAALVAGGVAAKTGLLAKLFALVLAMKKFVILIIAGIAGFFGRIFKRKGSAGTPAA